MVDRLGLPLAVAVHEVNLHDSKGTPMVIEQLENMLLLLVKILADGGYRVSLADLVAEKFEWTVAVTFRSDECQRDMKLLITLMIPEPIWANFIR